MKDTDVQVLCGCSADTRCPQGRAYPERQCVVVVPEDDLIRIVTELPRFKRKWIMNSNEEVTGVPITSHDGLSHAERIRLRALEQAVAHNGLDIEGDAASYEHFLLGGSEDERTSD